MIPSRSRYAPARVYPKEKNGNSRLIIDVSEKDTIVSTTLLTHRVVEGDTLESIAYKFYGEATKWWVIADANDIFDTDRVSVGTLLDVPSPTVVGRE